MNEKNAEIGKMDEKVELQAVWTENTLKKPKIGKLQPIAM